MMLRWLGEALYEARDSEKARELYGRRGKRPPLLYIASLIPARGQNPGEENPLGVYPSTLSHLERGMVGRDGQGGWPARTDEIVDAYAQATGRTSFELWMDAVTRWAEADARGEIRGAETARKRAREALAAADSQTESHSPKRSDKPAAQGNRRRRPRQSA